MRLNITPATHSFKLRELVLLAVVTLFTVVCVGRVHAETISGVVRDQTGAVIAGAKIDITGGSLLMPLLLTSDRTGNFLSPDLPSGSYSVRVTQQGFESVTQTVDLHGSNAQLDFKLVVAEEHVSVSVSAARTEFANSDPIYRQLRDLGTGPAYRFDNFTLQCDVGTFHFQQGTLTLLKPVEGVVTGAIFVGEGHFTLKPAISIEAEHLKRITKAEQIDEDFSAIVFRFGDGLLPRFTPGFGSEVSSDAGAEAFKHWKDLVRKRREQPLGFTEYFLHGEAMDNVDADVLAAIYNRQHPEFVNAYMTGKKHKDLRFFVRLRVGALPQLDSPEEVALINYDPEGMEDGVWYLAHLQSEYLQHKASSQEDRRLFATHKYKIETIIAKNRHLFSTATVTFQSLVAGERLLKFALLPNLRVTRVVDAQGQDLYYVQESRKEDGSFYVILPQAADPAKEYSITVQYAGDKVLEAAGEGSFYVRARTSWYPNLNGFGEHALFDLTYKVPRQYKVISVGKLIDESTEQGFAVSHWITPTPVAVAGFNYGDYQKVELPDPITGYKISGYYVTELPDMFRNVRALQSVAPQGMTRYALEQARAQLQLCTYYFGKSPYDEIFITEQPDFAFGQSWPNLIYLPLSAYTDSTQRWMLFGTISKRFTGFVQEVTPHEVAHQWWGHAVGWASYHDQWLSEGFAEFSAGLFLQQAVGPDWRKDYIDFWDGLRKRILDKNNFGIAATDAGPLWLGLRLTTPRSPGAYFDLTYPKGAYVLQMLRSMMYTDGQDKDKAFIAMMHDFVESHRNVPASTESFKAIAEKHMTKDMDFEHNGRLDWFFNEWVYRTEIPKYNFEYQITPAEGGKAKLHMTLTQSEVDDRFAMLVPVFLDLGKGPVRFGQIPIVGNNTRSFDVTIPVVPKKIVLNAYKDVLER